MENRCGVRFDDYLSTWVERQTPSQESTMKTVPLSPAISLAGIECFVVLSDTQLAQDWCACLSTAGARTWERHEPWPAVAASGVLRVVITDTIDSLDILPSASATTTRGFGVVSVKEGRRRQPRLSAPGIVSLDTPLLRKESMLKAVAMAAGRTMPLISKRGKG